MNEPKSPHEFLNDNPIRLVSEDPAEYRNDVLAKIVPRILNPLGKLFTTTTATVLHGFKRVSPSEGLIIPNVYMFCVIDLLTSTSQ